MSKQIKVNSAQALGFPSQHGTDVTAAVLKHWCGRMHLIVAGQRYSVKESRRSDVAVDDDVS